MVIFAVGCAFIKVAHILQFLMIFGFDRSFVGIKEHFDNRGSLLLYGRGLPDLFRNRNLNRQ